MILKFLLIIVGLFCLIGFLFGFSVLRWMFRTIFGIKSDNRTSSSKQQKSSKTTNQKNSASDRKVFSRDEGEYVDYEEIKD